VRGSHGFPGTPIMAAAQGENQQTFVFFVSFVVN
jgi:hypothetical protein